MTSSDPSSRLSADLRRGSLLGAFAQATLRGELGELMAPLAVLEPSSLRSGVTEWLGPQPTVDRTEIAEALQIDNRRYGHSRTDEWSKKLADPATRVVVTGQQVGFLGGPLYTFTKALAASLWAQRIEEETGSPAVAVFWMATEDHDYAEVAKAFLPQLSDPKFCLPDDPQPLVPMGARKLGTEVEAVVRGVCSAWSQRLEHRTAALERLRQLESWYSAEATWGDAFGQLMSSALGDHCPLLLDSQLPALKRLQAPWHRQLIERRVEVEAVLDEAHGRVAAAGLSPRTRRVAGESPLFVLDEQGLRRRVCFEDDRFTLRGGSEAGSPEELLGLLARAPERFGPGALARALTQDAILGSSLQILGPGEVAYMAEAAPIYDLLGVEAPKIAQRPQGALVPPKLASRLTELAEQGFTPTVLFGSEGSIELQLASRACADPVAGSLPEIEKLLAEVERCCVDVDSHLERPAKKTRGAILGSLQKLQAKATASRARQDEVLVGRIESARGQLFPGAPQDRVVTAAHFFVEIDGFGDWFANALELDPSSLQILTLPY